MTSMIDTCNRFSNSELCRLREMLIAHDIPFDGELISNEDGIYRKLYYPNMESFSNPLPGETVRTLSCSVIEGPFDPYLESSSRLEIIGLLTDEEAEKTDILYGLTADEVFDRIEIAEKQRLEIFKHFGHSGDWIDELDKFFDKTTSEIDKFFDETISEKETDI